MIVDLLKTCTISCNFCAFFKNKQLNTFGLFSPKSFSFFVFSVFVCKTCVIFFLVMWFLHLLFERPSTYVSSWAAGVNDLCCFRIFRFIFDSHISMFLYTVNCEVRFPQLL